jgi:hypothetical protein
MLIHEIVTQWPILQSRRWAITAGDIPLPDDAFLCSVCLGPRSPPFALVPAILRFKVLVAWREILFEMDRRLRIGDLKARLKKRFTFAEGKLVIKLESVALGDYWQLGSVLCLEQRKLVLEAKGVKIMIQFQNSTGAGKCTMEFGIDDRAAVVFDRWAGPTGTYHFFRDQEKRYELFLDRSAWLADFDFGDAPVIVEFVPKDEGPPVSLELVLPLNHPRQAVTIDPNMRGIEIVRRAHDVFLQDGYYGLSLEENGRLLRLGIPVSELTGDGRKLTLFVQFSAEQRENAVYLDSPEAIRRVPVKPPLLRPVESARAPRPKSPLLDDTKKVIIRVENEMSHQIEITRMALVRQLREQLAEQIGASVDEVILSADGNEVEDGVVVGECPDVIKCILCKEKEKKRKPLDYAKKWKSLVAVTGKSPLLCRECYNRFAYVYDDALAELNRMEL